MTEIYTIGHSTRSVEEFIDLLRIYNVESLVDMRTIPRSRKNPQFESDSISESLYKNGIKYTHMKGLGGLRHPKKDSENKGWRNLSFRGYADYMQTEEFKENLEKLIDLSKTKIVAIMCAESVPWRCHRSLVGDALLVRGVGVIDIISKTSSRKHELTKWAKVSGTKITYPEEAGVTKISPSGC